MKKLLSCLLLALPVAVFAHPGHGEGDGYTIIHYFTAAQHVIVGSVALLVTVLAVQLFKNRKRQRA